MPHSTSSAAGCHLRWPCRVSCGEPDPPDSTCMSCPPSFFWLLSMLCLWHNRFLSSFFNYPNHICRGFMGTVNFLANVVFLKFPSCGNPVGGYLESAWQSGLSFLDGWCHRPESTVWWEDPARTGIGGQLSKGLASLGNCLWWWVGHSEPGKTRAITGRLVQSPCSRLWGIHTWRQTACEWGK